MTTRPLRRYFFRIFIPLLLVFALVIGLETVFMVWSMWETDRQWPLFVTEDYVDKVMARLETEDDLSASRVLDVFIDAMDERISGLLIHDQDGGVMLYGSSPSQLVGTDVSWSVARSMDMSSPVTFSKDVPVYAVNLETDGNGGSSLSMMRLDGAFGHSFLTYIMPSGIREQDVASTIFVMVDGSIAGSLDLLIVDIRSFESTRFLLDAAVMTLVWMIPVSLLVSVIASLLMSRRDTRSITRIRSALEDLSVGRYDVDIPPQKAYELEEISSMVKELGQNLKRNRIAREEWIRSIAHDLNTPITGINVMVEGLEDGVYQADGPFLSSLRKEVDTLSSRVAAVRFYANLLSPDAHADLHDENAEELVEGFLSTYHAPSRVDAQVEAGLVLHVDRQLFYRALKEVLDNALHAQKEGAVSLEVHHGRVVVRNAGRLPEGHPDLFEPWARGDQGRSEGGSGLGLPIVGQIMRLSGGGVDIAQAGDEVVVTLDFTGQCRSTS